MSESDSEEYKEVCWQCYKQCNDDHNLASVLWQDGCMDPQSHQWNDSCQCESVRLYESGTYNIYSAFMVQYITFQSSSYIFIISFHSRMFLNILHLKLNNLAH